ncbi:MAG: hypothetical protein ACLGIT_02040 [Gammaproteobacteria bacterium]
MKPFEEAPHLLRLWRQKDDAGRRRLLRQIAELMVRRLTKGDPPFEGFDAGDDEHLLHLGAMPPADERLQPAATVLRTTVLMLEHTSLMTDDIFVGVLFTYAALDPDLTLGRTRRRQVREFGVKGAAARLKYSDADRARWRRLYAESYARHSARRAAALIAKAEGLPDSAVESVRQALLKKAVTPPPI